MDWAIVVTGAVGLAGIGGTLLSARMTGKSDAANLRESISAEHRRARLAEKRRIYAICLTKLMDAALSSDFRNSSYDRERAVTAIKDATYAVYEVNLIGSAGVRSLATLALDRLVDTAEPDPGKGVFQAVTGLTGAMRTDLGEPLE